MRRSIVWLMGVVIALGLGGCSTGHDTVDTSLYDTIAITAEKSELFMGQTCTITATVKNAGKEVVGREVTYGFVSNVTGATLTNAKVITNGAGEAKVLYAAGTNTAGSDIIRASLSNGAVIDITIVVEVGGFSITVMASPNSLVVGEMSTVSVTVKNAKGAAASGAKVIFGFLANKSGATLVPLLNGITDAAGQATAIYTAGGNNPNTVIQDGISATVGNSAGVGIITRTDGAAGLTVTVNADPNSLAAGEVGTITAIVKNARGTAVSGVYVNFGFLINKSGGTLSPLLNGITDASGQASAIYTAGNIDPSRIVQDIVSATAGSNSGIEIITRTDSAGLMVTVTANPNSLGAGEVSTITATVKNAKGAAIPGVFVNFVFLANQSGATLTTLFGGFTDAAGQATALYTAGGNNASMIVQDSISATASGTSGVEIITRTATTAKAVTLTANPTGFGGSWVDVTVESILTATVTGGGSNLAGIVVTFSIETPTVAGERMTPWTAITNGRGEAVARYTRPYDGTGGKILVVLKATLPDGTYNMITLEIDYL